MAVYLTGDTHRDFSRFQEDAFPEQSELQKSDYVLICGDFGGVWDGSPEENDLLDWLDARPFTTLFVSGNHENYALLSGCPVEEWHGGLTRRVRPSIRLLQRGQIFDLDGKRFFTMGGASSREIPILERADPLFSVRRKWHEYRKNVYWIRGETWFPEEMPNEDEYRAARENLDRAGWAVDYVVTHCAPTSIQNLFDLTEAQSTGSYLVNRLTDFLDEIAQQCTFDCWFFGHYHGNYVIENRYILLYDRIIQLAQ
ncbi:MAG: metallophosphatase family protein [Oscillibacter sp.]|nr:metallophosphatase family protein [Oscillibacter sp.]